MYVCAMVDKSDTMCIYLVPVVGKSDPMCMCVLLYIRVTLYVCIGCLL